MTDTTTGRYPAVFRFDCPHCGEPWARTREMIVDIHSGALYHCHICKGPVIFVAYTPQELQLVIQNQLRPPEEI